LEREANIARNRALLEQLELREAVAALGMPSKAKAKPSARLRRTVADPNETPGRKRKREQEDEALRAKLEEERLAEEERRREAKKPRHQDLDLTTLSEDIDDLSGLRRVLELVTKEPCQRRVGDQDAFVFEEDKKEEAEVEALRERLQTMKIVARAKVSGDRVYSAAYHPETSKDLIFFGDKHGELAIWDPRAQPEEETADDDDVKEVSNPEGGQFWRLQTHWPATAKSSISSIRFDPLDAHTVYTSSYDCTVRSLSFTSGVSREIFSTDDVLISCVDLPPGGNEMWISDNGGGVTHLDLRQDRSKARWYQLSEQKIGSVSVNPREPHFLLTASNTRLLKVWDVRKLEKLPAKNGSLDFEYDAIDTLITSADGKSCLRGEWPHNKSVSSAYWDPRGRSIVSTSYDDTVRLWDIKPASFARNAPFSAFKPFSRFHHSCQTGQWVTVLKAQWSQYPDVLPHFTIGNLNHSLDIFSYKGDLLARLADRERVSATPAVTCSHPSVVERAASGTASGKCYLWAPSDTDDEERE
ncbi:hypothetical protein EWM64_g10275, partial [Hericium alpestre]